jgi:hypothetical protein
MMGKISLVIIAILLSSCGGTEVGPTPNPDKTITTHVDSGLLKDTNQNQTKDSTPPLDEYVMPEPDAEQVQHDSKVIPHPDAKVVADKPKTCTNKCAVKGEHKCVSTTTYTICDDTNGDTCLELSAPQACATGSTCQNGVCKNLCTGVTCPTCDCTDPAACGPFISAGKAKHACQKCDPATGKCVKDTTLPIDFIGTVVTPASGSLTNYVVYSGPSGNHANLVLPYGVAYWYDVNETTTAGMYPTAKNLTKSVQIGICAFTNIIQAVDSAGKTYPGYMKNRWDTVFAGANSLSKNDKLEVCYEVVGAKQPPKCGTYTATFGGSSYATSYNCP